MQKGLSHFYTKAGSPLPACPAAEKDIDPRSFHRLKCQVSVSIKDLRNLWETDAKCLDISMGGIGFEIDDNEELQFNVQDRLELWIHLQDGLNPVHRYGRLIWLRQVSPLIYKGGIRFEAKLKAHVC